MLTLADLIQSEQGFRPDRASLGISEVVVDSRQAIPASMFVAIASGHSFVKAAFDRGAHLALIQDKVDDDIRVLDLTVPFTQSSVIPSAPFAVRVKDSTASLQKLAAFWRQKFDLKVIGITGSVGKSTTKELVAEVLSHRFKTLKNIGNYNNEVGLPLTLLRLGKGYECAVLEMGFFVPGEIKQLCDIALPQVGILTNIGTVHAERAGSQAEIARGKSELVQALPADPEGTAILNIDDPWIVPMASQTKARVFFYGIDPKAELWADDIISQGLNGIHFTLHYHGQSYSMQAPVIGRHSIHTVLRTVAAGLVEGMQMPEIIHALQQASSQLRLVAVHTRQGALLLDDTYNASPESTLAALNLLNDLPGRKIAVLGGMYELGMYEKSGHEMIGIRAAEVADQLITFGEHARMISASAIQAGLASSAVTSFDEVDEVVDALQSILKQGDIVLVKGSHGLRMDRIVQALEVEA
ncbi:MAG: UDP-N-acetylmuramoylalanyl-D-glutamyl-2, 6-diaminopimelate--D-alanyl-D-alanine ligase [Chloroflexi bacterium HGW-Chloroflexi-4]|jgi:UDP-N-acetylmuramoyl-tripeptide--D-alanyl-D-alanine ligase|nr:MAG: UDP-N-acetylmuramoylalanyl-D-glutamyl-2, 6-diaminopimelate--D-alanyl-D-alanine ligase [Chloroflexi bacterium HGW-Chloroflexi-4]